MAESTGKKRSWNRRTAFASVLFMAALIGGQACTGEFGAMKASFSESSSASDVTPLPSVSSSPVPDNLPVTPAPASIALPAAITGQRYKLTFDDEFTSTTHVSNGATFVAGANWYNGNEQCCMSDTSGGLPGAMFPSVVNGVSVNPYSLISGGGLNITLSKVNNVWYSGVLTSVDSAGRGFSQQYGYFEITAQLPGDPGTWPAFWLLNTSQKTGKSESTGGIGEIDVFEQYGNFHNAFCTTFHDWSGGTSPYYNCGFKVDDMTAGYHKFGMLWTESTTAIYFDDVKIGETPTPSVMKQPYYMLIDLGLGGGWPTDQTPVSSTMKVKSVKVWAADQ